MENHCLAVKPMGGYFTDYRRQFAARSYIKNPSDLRVLSLELYIYYKCCLIKKKEGIYMAKTVRIIQKAKIYHPKSERLKMQNKSSEKNEK